MSDFEVTREAGPYRVNMGQRILAAVGSLWFAAVLLLLLLLILACATVYESTHGTPRALATFYRSWWFEAMLALVGVNVLASALLRWPFSWRLAGFVVTHMSILVVFAGAYVTRHHGLDGQLALAEGTSADRFVVPEPTLQIMRRGDGTREATTLNASVFDGFEEVERPRAPRIGLGDLEIRVQHYLPHSAWTWRVFEDNPRPQAAVEIALGGASAGETYWVFAGEPTEIAGRQVSLRPVAGEEEMARLAPQESAKEQPSDPTVQAQVAGQNFAFPLSQCLSAVVPLGNTGFSLRVQRYLPHAQVGDNRQLVNASDKPVNPAIEAEVIGPNGTESKRAFANFPDMGAGHGQSQAAGVRLRLVMPEAAGATDADLEILAIPGGRAVAVFRAAPGSPAGQDLAVGRPVNTPWSGMVLTLRRRVENARLDWYAAAEEPGDDARLPAVLLRLTRPGAESEVWVQKHRLRSVAVGDQAFDLRFEDREIALGFALGLERFHMDVYPGERRPRTFESFITLTDPGGAPQAAHISMNVPVSHGGYTFYQSSYAMGRGATTSVLSVARDPGRPIAFAGYIGLMVGMLAIMVTRVIEQRATQRAAAALRPMAAGLAGLVGRREA